MSERFISMDVAVNPAITDQRIVLYASGHCQARGGAPAPLGTPNITNYPKNFCVRIQVTDWLTPSGYILDINGTVHEFGTAAPANQAGIQAPPYWRHRMMAIDFSMSPAADGAGYILDVLGRMHRFGGNNTRTPLLGSGAAFHDVPFSKAWAKALSVQWNVSNNATGLFAIMVGNGAIYVGNGTTKSASPNYVPNGPSGEWFGNLDRARDFVVDWAASNAWLISYSGKTFRAWNQMEDGRGRVGGEPRVSAQRQYRALSLISNGVSPNPLTFLALDSRGSTAEWTVSGPPRIAVQPFGDNLLSQENADFEHLEQDVADWVAGASTALANSGTRAYTGDSALRLTRTGYTGSATANTPTGTAGVPCSANVKYRVRAKVRANTTTRAARIGIRFYTAAGAALGAGVTYGSTVTDGPGWKDVEVEATSGGTAAFAAVFLDIASVVVGELHYYDQIQLYPAVITTTTRPEFAWQFWDPDGDGQQAAQVRLFTDAEYGIGGFDPETSPATLRTSVTDPDVTFGIELPDLANDTYRLYVRSRDTADEWSSWDYLQFEVNVVRPSAPSINAVAQPASGRIHLSITMTPTASFVRVEYKDADSDTWEVVRGCVALAASASFGVEDYEARTGIARSYRAEQYNENPYLASNWSATDTDTLWPNAWWLKDPLEPDLNTLIKKGVGLDISGQGTIGVYEPLGRSQAVAVTDAAPKGSQLSVQIFAIAGQDKIDLDALLSPYRPLMLQGPGLDEFWFVHLSSPPTIVRQRGKTITDAGVRPDPTGVERMHELNLDFAEIARPDDPTLVTEEVA